MSAKKNKDTENTSDFGAFFLGLLSAILGAVIGVIYMASFPAVTFNSMSGAANFLKEKSEREARPGDVYFFKGQSLGTREWEATRKSLIDGAPGSVVDLADRDLNAWFGSKFRIGAPPKGEALPNLTIAPSLPNVFFADEFVHISLPIEVFFMGDSYSHVIIAKGVFSDINGQLNFQMESLYLDNAGVPFLDVVGSAFVNQLLRAYSETDEYGVFQEIWGRVESVEQSEGNLRLTLR
ncbi:MAG: hypothetical protein ACSHX8_06705 [Opitutaceae bacterium]